MQRTLVILCLQWLFAVGGAALSFPALAATTSESERLSTTAISCTERPTDRLCRESGADWVWLEADHPRQLGAMLGNWQLLVDRTRVAAIRIRIVDQTGVHVRQIKDGEFGTHWSLGANYRFTIAPAGADVSALAIGFHQPDDIGLVRSIKALSSRAHSNFASAWLAVIAFVGGVLALSLVYNLFLLLWLKTHFQRWYVAWVACALGYLLLWSGGIFFVLPDAANASGIRIERVLLGGLVAAASLFFVEFMEDGTLPQRLKTSIRGIAVIAFAASLMAACDNLLPAKATDLLLNLVFVATMLCMLVGIACAVARKSRLAWFFILAWAPSLIVFGIRIARNLSVFGQSDAIDIAGFFAIAFEAAALSLGIADRFRTLRQLSDMEAAERETLTRLATTDPMTGCCNRMAFQAELSRLEAIDAQADLIIIDVDLLKETNDTAGHDVGDALIVAVGERLCQASGAESIVARLGGDEFAVILWGDARGRIDAVRALITQPDALALANAVVPLSLSAGHAATTGEHGGIRRLYKEADLALYRAKSEGRGHWRAFDDSLRDEDEARRRMIVEAQVGILRREFLVHFQPIVDLRTNVLVKHEALLRWQHPVRGLLLPGEFLSALDEPYLLKPIQEDVLETALRAVACGTTPIVAVNFIAAQLQGEQAATVVLDRIRAHGVPPCSLTIEVKETVALSRSNDQVFRCLAAVAKAGVGVALDDFGTGYASLVHLRDMPTTILKIDRSLVSALPHDAVSLSIVGSIIALGHALGKRIVAEGVETEDQADTLRVLGCDWGQGYLFGYAQALSDVAKRFAA